jgi:hypothetical protein
MLVRRLLMPFVLVTGMLAVTCRQVPVLARSAPARAAPWRA